MAVRHQCKQLTCLSRPYQVLDEIHAIIKKNVHTRFEKLTSNTIELRRHMHKPT